MNDYPFLDNKGHPVSDQTLGDIGRSVGRHRVIDISHSPFVKASDLRGKLDYLLMAGELDSALAIVRDSILVGLIPVTDLEFALDKLDDEDSEFCMMSHDLSWNGEHPDGTVVHDFTIYIDPVSLYYIYRKKKEILTKCTVAGGPRCPLSARPGLPVFCQTGTPIYLC